MSASLRSKRAFVAWTLVAALGACTATSNPDRSELSLNAHVTPQTSDAPKSAPTPNPAPTSAPTAGPTALETSLESRVDPKPSAAPTSVAATETAAAPQERTASEPANPAPQAAATGAATSATTPKSSSNDAAQKPVNSDVAPPTPLSLGRVGDEGLPVGEFLRRLWLHDNSTARDVVEQMVFARMVLFEADRFGVQLAPAQVDAEVKTAIAGVEKRLADKGSKLTFDEHVRRNLELDPKLYRLSMRNDAIVALLAERCVRAWALESGVCRVRVSEFREKSKLESARADLAAGKSFEEVANAYGLGEDEDAGLTAMPIVRAENQELSRVAFATEVGQIGGPIEQSGAWLLMRVDSRDDGRDVTWAADGKAIETSLDVEPVHNMEYVQWRAAMTRRYQLDLSPFLDLVGGGKP